MQRISNPGLVKIAKSFLNETFKTYSFCFIRYPTDGMRSDRKYFFFLFYFCEGRIKNALSWINYGS